MRNYIYMAAGAVALAAAFGIGWQINGWRKDVVIADLKNERAEQVAAQAGAALQDLAEASRRIRDEADAAQIDLSAVNNQLAAIRKEYKNAKPAPLPPDCRPDVVRVRKLTDAAGAVDKAIAGQRAGSGVQAER